MKSGMVKPTGVVLLAEAEGHLTVEVRVRGVVLRRWALTLEESALVREALREEQRTEEEYEWHLEGDEIKP
jgi:hypothetical protein